MTTTQLPPAQPPVAQKNGQALASLILGIVSLFANLLLIPTLLGIVFGIIGVAKSRTLGRKGMAIAGIVLSVVGAIVGIVVFVSILGAIGKAATDTSNALATPAASVGDDGSATSSSAEPTAAAKPSSSDSKVPDGYKAISDDVWFKWGKTDDSNQFLTTKSATVITPNGCASLLIEANEYDKSGTNVGTAVASASNLDAGDKAKLQFSWSPDDHVSTVKVKQVTCF